MTEMFEAMERGELRTLYVIGENPAQSEADQTKARKLLTELDCLIVQDIYLTKTAEMADVVLPGLGVVGRVQRHGHELRAARADRAQGAGSARRRARRQLDHHRARATARLRVGGAGGRADLGRAALAEPDARRHELRAARGQQRPPMAVRARSTIPARSSSMAGCGRTRSRGRGRRSASRRTCRRWTSSPTSSRSG